MRCLNCQNEFQGDYCPHCGQSAATRRFTIKNAFSSTLEVWGMGNRSLPRTLWHLFRRPGIMIGEYIDGKRIPFFPPVKMLFVLCIFFAVVSSWRCLYSACSMPCCSLSWSVARIPCRKTYRQR